MTEDEIKKRDDERAKKEQDESEEVQTLAKRKGYKMYIHGKNFRKANTLRVLFSFEDETATQILQPIFKNENCLAVQIPDLGEAVPVGNHLVSVDLTINGQQFTQQALQFMYNSVDPNLTAEELKKLDEDEAKNLAKKGGAKKR